MNRKQVSKQELDNLYYSLQDSQQQFNTFSYTPTAIKTEEGFKKDRISDEGIYDWLPDFVKAGYNNSLTGGAQRLLAGEVPFNLENYNPTVLEELGAAAVTLFMPSDWIATLGSGKAIASLGTLTRVGNMLFKRLLQSGVKKELSESMVQGGVKILKDQALFQAGALGSYRGISSALNQQIEENDVDWKEVFSESTKGALSGAVGGAIFGRAIGRGSKTITAYTQEGVAFGAVDPLLQGRIPEPMDFINSVGLALGITGSRAAARGATKFVKGFMGDNSLKGTYATRNLTLEDINQHEMFAKQAAMIQWDNTSRRGKKWDRVLTPDEKTGFIQGDFSKRMGEDFGMVSIVGREKSKNKDQFTIIDEFTKKTKSIDRTEFFKRYQESDVSRIKTEQSAQEMAQFLGRDVNDYIVGSTRDDKANIKNISDKMLNSIHKDLYLETKVQTIRRGLAKFSADIPKKDLWSHILPEDIANHIRPTSKSFQDEQARGLIFQMFQINKSIGLRNERNYKDLEKLRGMYENLSEGRKNRLFHEINGSVPASKENREIINFWKNLMSERMKYAEGGGIVPAGYIENYVMHQAKAGVKEELIESIFEIGKASGSTFAEGTVNAADAKRLDSLIRDRILSNVSKGSFKMTIDNYLKQLRKTNPSASYADAYILMRNKIFPSYYSPHRSIEKERLFNLPEELLEKDLLKLLAVYDMSLPIRVETARLWGSNNELVNKIILDPKGGIKNKKEAARMKALVDVMTHASQNKYHANFSPAIRKFADSLMGFETSTKIAGGRATLANVFQPLYSILPFTGFWPMARGFASVMRKDFRDNLPTSHREAISQILGEATTNSLWRKIANFTSKWSGFTFINKANNVLASASAHYGILDQIKRANSKPGSVASNRAIARLKKIYDIDYKVGKELSEDKMAAALVNFASKTQLHVNLLDEPLVLSNPLFRPLVMFKRFAIKQPRLILNGIKDDMTLRDPNGRYIGSPMMLVRLAIGGFVGGEAYGWGSDKWNKFWSGEPYEYKDEEGVSKFLENMASVGSLGMLSDFLSAEDRVSSFRFFVTPVFISDIEKALDGFAEFSKSIDTFGFSTTSFRRALSKSSGILGSNLRGLLGERILKTEGQRRSAQSSRKSRVKKDIHKKLLENKKESALRLARSWNEQNPFNPLTFDDISYKSIYEAALRKHMRVKTENMSKEEYRAYTEFMRGN